ncbi:MAG: amidohydrolase family protein [Desulfobacterales bacterium]|nr:amidohydrolase family protein [Desulfobacterales bacterium]
MAEKKMEKNNFSTLSRPRRLPAQIAIQISKKIREGVFPPGSKLPSEARIAVEFGVSRTAVREAIASLRQDGYVETQQGKGAFVSPDFEFKAFKIDSKELATLEDLRAVMELRIEMQVGGAAMAARRRSHEQLCELMGVLEKMKQTIDAEKDFFELEAQFHRVVAEATHNKHYCDFIQFLSHRIRTSLAFETPEISKGSRAAGKILREYEEIYEAIRLGDPDKARRAAWYHILRSASRLGLRGLQGWEESRMTLIGDSYIPTCAEPDPNPGTPKLVVPRGACDCHAHILGPRSRYPYTPHRSYTPPDASLTSYKEVLSALGLERAVIVQPSVYGTDNRATLDAIRQGGENFRAVVVVDENIDVKEMERMHEMGARGVRINLLFKSGIEVSDVKKLAEKIAPFGWHLQMLVDVSEFSDLDTLAKLPVDVVFDHMGHMPASLGVDHPGFKKMLRILEGGRAWVKVSGAYRISGCTMPPYEDTGAFARKIIETNPDRVVWATDWPHPCINVPMPKDADLLDLLAQWAPDEEIRNKILVTNPARLYEFGPLL